jgi:hypothetical protein
MTFMNGHLYCGINNGAVLVLKRLTLTPLLIFNAHMHQLHNLCPLTFETRLVTFNQKIDNSKNTNEKEMNTIVKKTTHVLVSLGRALAPAHEDIYLSSTSYRDRCKALKKYANCLILGSWNCTES